MGVKSLLFFLYCANVNTSRIHFKRKMDIIFKYNSNIKYSTEDLARTNSVFDLVTQKMYLNERDFVDLKFTDIVKDHEVIPDSEKNGHYYPGDSWSMPNSLLNLSSKSTFTCFDVN